MMEVFDLLFSFSFLFSCLSINMFLQSPQPEDRLGYPFLNDPKFQDYVMRRNVITYVQVQHHFMLRQLPRVMQTQNIIVLFYYLKPLAQHVWFLF